MKKTIYTIITVTQSVVAIIVLFFFSHWLYQKWQQRTLYRWVDEISYTDRVDIFNYCNQHRYNREKEICFCDYIEIEKDENGNHVKPICFFSKLRRIE